MYQMQRGFVISDPGNPSSILYKVYPVLSHTHCHLINEQNLIWQLMGKSLWYTFILHLAVLLCPMFAAKLFPKDQACLLPESQATDLEGTAQPGVELFLPHFSHRWTPELGGMISPCLLHNLLGTPHTHNHGSSTQQVPWLPIHPLLTIHMSTMAFLGYPTDTYTGGQHYALVPSHGCHWLIQMRQVFQDSARFEASIKVYQSRSQHNSHPEYWSSHSSVSFHLLSLTSHLINFHFESELPEGFVSHGDIPVWYI